MSESRRGGTCRCHQNGRDRSLGRPENGRPYESISWFQGALARIFESRLSLGFPRGRASRPASFKLKLGVVIALGVLAIGAGRSPIARAGVELAGDFHIDLPLGVPLDVWNYFIPNDNRMTEAKVALGRELFFDKRVSADGSLSCSSCHQPRFGFTDGKPVPEGINGRKGTRSAPTLLNAMFNSGQFWDGRVESLEEQARQPLVNPDEMGNRSVDAVVARLAAIPEYSAKFNEVFGGPVTIESFGKAIAAFERTLVSGNSAFDRYTAGNREALSDSARRGMLLFNGKARCSVCHTFAGVFAVNQSFPFFTDQMYHNTGVAVNDATFEGLARKAAALAKTGPSKVDLDSLAAQPGTGALGRFLVTGNVMDIGAFRTPSLRDVELTAPYFHDGSAKTLEDVVKFYAKGGNNNPNRDWQLEPIRLSDQERTELVEFLKSLTSDGMKRIVDSETENSLP
jgi:cytochrome c peroxidase